MGKSTHPFVMRMNEHKAIHRAMRAGEEAQDAPTSHGAADPDDMAKGGNTLAHKTGKRKVQLKKKNAAPTKGILTAVVK